MRAQKLFESAVGMQLEGNLDGARQAYKRLLRDYPSNSEVLGNLAVIVKKEGQLDTAEMLLQRAIRANPKNFSALTTLANIRLDQKRFDEARNFNDAALTIEPDFPDALVNRGVLLIRDHKLESAEDHFWRAMQLDPRNANAKVNLANTRRLRKVNIEASIEMLRAVAAEQPDNAAILLMLCSAYQETYQFVRALECAEQAIALTGGQDVECLMQAGNTLVILGEFEAAMDYYRRASALNEDNLYIDTSYLFALNYDDRKTAAQVFEDYQHVGRKVARGKKKFDHSARPAIRDRRIRIGYSSGDFCSHVVSFFIEPILRNHDHSQFEVIAYASVVKPDDHTLHLKRYFDKWVDILEMSDEEAANRIHDDGCDILIDLAGHTAANRLAAMAMRPAPIQATYLGFGYTTGMSEIDYFIGDRNFTPDGCEPFFSEKVLRIAEPVYAYNPPRHRIPDVQPPPALEKGYITFGSMSRMIRLNTKMLAVWKQILDRVPGSRLRLDQKPFEDAGTCERFLGRLEAIGYRREQVELTSTSPHWDGYHQFDIALDCWPHNAGTTTFEALFLGVPVISKRDRPSVGRLSDMALTPIGLGDWVADTEQEFVDKAVALASDLPALAEIRQGLRERISASPFLDFKARTRGLEAGYREMVRRYNERRP